MTAVPLQWVLWGLLGIALAIGLVSDLVARRIPDLLTWPTLLLALGARLAWQGLGAPDSGLLSGLLGAVLGAGLLLLGNALSRLLGRSAGFGGGDVKLMAVVGAAFGYPVVLAALVLISLVGALQALVTLIWQGKVWDTVADAGRVLLSRLGWSGSDAPPVSRHIPYGVSIAVGSFWAMWWEYSHR